jgi:formylglycine-generating enzyme required for sulfatase activity
VPVPPHPIFNRWVVVATVLVVVVIGGLLALAFLPHNPSWEQEHRDEILDLKQSAANLQITGDQAAALEKYHELVRLIAGQTIYDPELLDALADARRKCDDLLKSSTNIKPRSEATAHSTTMVFTPPMLEQPQSKLPTPSATTVVAAASILAVTPKAINEGVRGNSGTAAIDLGITTNDLGMKLVWIKPGSFLMGSPATEGGRFDDEIQHRVTLTSGFLCPQCL